MKKQTFTPHFRAKWLKLFLLLFLATTVTFWGCDKAKEAVNPVKALQATQAQQAKKDSDADDKYKTDKTGQYVSKDVQVPDNGGKERPTRPKYDILDYSKDQMAALSVECTNCDMIAPPDDPCDACGLGGGGSTVTSNFVSSEGLIDPYSAPNAPWSGDIYALRIIKGSSPNILPSQGHIKINVDLNKGAGGKYIYLTFSREEQYSYENDGVHPAETYNVPLTDMYVEAHTQFGNINDGAPLRTYRHLYDFNGTTSLYPNDLNDGAGGRYIYAYVSRETMYGSPIREVGVLYGNSSSIQPPTTDWIKIDRDLNEGAGGDYIYLCYKR